ncbi:hypothetical protein AB6A40_001914 [Gnathostoma spinigerum]|uniref:Uncharacterized protein n=1 Tax=Gnathostoma spinigerum TaxID=75299 RepID=A0ABD6E6B1_9BILA
MSLSERLYDRFFIEPYREERRKRLNRSRLDDIFYFSGVYDYKFVRLFVNFPIGFILSSALYAFECSSFHRDSQHSNDYS